MSNFIADALEPKRSTGTITLSWGLLNIPLSTFTGTEDTTIGRKEFVDGEVDHPAGRAVIDKTTGEVVDSARVVRMAEASNGVFVVLDDDEIAACTGNPNVAEIITFIKKEDADFYVPNKLMQVRPHRTKGIPDPAAAKAFTLLVSAMASQGVSALVKVAMRGPAQYAILTATGDLIFIHYSDAVRKPLPMGLVPVAPEEQQAAQTLIDSIGVDQARNLPNVTASKVRTYVDAKVAGGSAPKEPSRPPVLEIDLMSKLLQSIDECKAVSPAWGAPSGAPASQEPVQS